MHDETKRGTDGTPTLDRRSVPRLPEELEAVITENVVASALLAQLPAEERENEIRYVAEGRGRVTRARRAVDVVRHALAGARGSR